MNWKKNLKNKNKIASFVLAFLLLTVGLIATMFDKDVEDILLETTFPGIQGTTDEGVLVTRIIDGDTIQIETGETVRYIGIDTPETRHPQREIECFGEEASAKNKELVEGKIIILEKDVSETDRYSRLLRYVYVDDVFVNEYLVHEGYATAASFSPDIKYQELFVKAEREAREAGRGLWGGCSR